MGNSLWQPAQTNEIKSCHAPHLGLHFNKMVHSYDSLYMSIWLHVHCIHFFAAVTPSQMHVPQKNDEDTSLLLGVAVCFEMARGTGALVLLNQSDIPFDPELEESSLFRWEVLHFMFVFWVWSFLLQSAKLESGVRAWLCLAGTQYPVFLCKELLTSGLFPAPPGNWCSEPLVGVSAAQV